MLEKQVKNVSNTYSFLFLKSLTFNRIKNILKFKFRSINQQACIYKLSILSQDSSRWNFKSQI